MNRYRADLHIHTALSPCADAEMTPPAIVQAARELGLALIAVCDHNSAANVAAVQEAAREGAGRPSVPGGPAELTVIAGMEITTREEAHVLGLFPDAAAALRAGERVRATLPLAAAAPHRAGAGIWGEQPLLDARGERIGVEERLLAAASGFSLAECVELIRGHGGLAVAAHLDRPSFSVLSQLGFLPEEVRFDAIEVSAAGVRNGRAAGLAALGLPLLASSDGHFLSMLGAAATLLELREPSFAELVLAVRGRDGRRCGVA